MKNVRIDLDTAIEQLNTGRYNLAACARDIGCSKTWLRRFIADLIVKPNPVYAARVREWVRFPRDLRDFQPRRQHKGLDRQDERGQQFIPPSPRWQRGETFYVRGEEAVT